MSRRNGLLDETPELRTLARWARTLGAGVAVGALFVAASVVGLVAGCVALAGILDLICACNR